MCTYRDALDLVGSDTVAFWTIKLLREELFVVSMGDHTDIVVLDCRLTPYIVLTTYHRLTNLVNFFHLLSQPL